MRAGDQARSSNDMGVTPIVQLFTSSTVIQNSVTNEGFVFELAETQRVRKHAQDFIIVLKQEAEVNYQSVADRIKAEFTKYIKQASSHDSLNSRLKAEAYDLHYAAAIQIRNHIRA